ncbi:MAG: DNA repair protein RecO [Planctomycetota bacterium]|jgi:recombinational DNA repair protein (RecF pathway)/outer membrane protein assembly factor BamD (BamD/ComL family)|nr:DNA repair protein RecO [Planctomycetota bacterium]
MPAEKARSIVIRSIPFGETSCVATLYTRELGKVRGLAKGAWRPKSGFDAALDLLSACQVLVLRKFSGGLDVLTEATLEDRFRVGSLKAFHGALYVVELLDALTADADPQPDLFDAAHATLRTLSSPRPATSSETMAEVADDAPDDDTVRTAVLHFELELLRIVGHGPALFRCAECQAAVGESTRTFFGMLDGGVLCSACRSGKRSVISISRDAMAGLRLLAGSRDAWQQLHLPKAAGGELRAIMNTYFANLLGRRLRAARWIAALLMIATSLSSGCATLQMPKWPWTGEDAAAKAKEDHLAEELGEDADSDVLSSEYVAASADAGFNLFKGETIRKQWKKMTGRGPNEPVAREALTEGDGLFRQGKYKKAISFYKKAIDRWPDSVIEEDAMWQLAECLFFTDQYPKAEDAYTELVKKYANTRYLDRVAQRQFLIGQYWLAIDEQLHLPVIVPNLVDRSRPLFDTPGRALKAFEHVRLNDPRGDLADDSIMATANSHFVDRQWLDADYFYELLRTEYPDSDFLLAAHLFGLQSKLQAYQGAAYEGGVLDEAELLADQVLVQFPDQLSAEDEERVMKARAEIAAQQATRHWARAEFYSKGKHYSAARIYYAMIARDYPKTMLAERARSKLGEIEGLEDVSDNPLPMLTQLFNPDSLKEAELDAMAEADEMIARQDDSGAGPQIR